jgi:hypothetical protein
VPRSISCCQPPTRNRYVGTPHTGSSRCLVESYPPSNVDCTMNAEVDHTIYWGLRALPLNNLPDPRFYLRSSQQDAAYGWMSNGTQTSRFLLLLTGDIGRGKTLLSRRLIVRLAPAQYDFALICQPEDCGPCASRPLHGRGDDVVYYGTHGRRGPMNRRVYQRRRGGHPWTHEGHRSAL